MHLVRRWLRRLKLWLFVQSLPEADRPQPHGKLTPFGHARMWEAGEFMRRKHRHLD